MNDVAYRIVTSSPVKHGTLVVGSVPFGGIASGETCTQFYRGAEKTIANEVPIHTGLVNRFDDYTYYSN